MGVLEELDKQAPALGVLDVLDGRIPVKGHLRGKPTKAERRAAIGQIPLTMAGPGGPITLDREAVAQNLPAVAATIAGSATKPFAAGVPAAAGAAGLAQGASSLMMGEVPSLGEIGRAAATHGAYEAGGRGLGLAAMSVSKPIMELALKHSPEVAATAIREGINATKLGFNKLMNRLGQYGRATDAIVDQASKRGRPYDMTSLVRQAYDDILTKVEVSMTGAEKEALDETVKLFNKQNPIGNASAKELHKLKKAADVAARAVYNLPPGVRPTPAQEAVAGFYKAYADRVRQTLNATVQGYEASNEPTEALIRLKDALRPMTRKEMSGAARLVSAASRPLGGAAIGAGIGAATPGNRGANAAAGALTGGLLGTPQALSSLALGMNSPLLQLILQQSPRAIGSAVQANWK